MSTLKKALFIDRDGTLLVEPADEQIDSLEKFAFVPGAISALKSLTGLDYELVMVSNQDGLGTPAFPTETFLPCQNLLLNTLEGEGIHFDNILIDKTFPYENAPTRKPGTGLLGAYLDGSYDLGESYVIGDRDSDLQLAENLGAQALQVGPMSWAEIAETIRPGHSRPENPRDGHHPDAGPGRKGPFRHRYRPAFLRPYAGADSASRRGQSPPSLPGRSGGG